MGFIQVARSHVLYRSCTLHGTPMKHSTDIRRNNAITRRSRGKQEQLSNRQRSVRSLLSTAQEDWSLDFHKLLALRYLYMSDVELKA